MNDFRVRTPIRLTILFSHGGLSRQIAKRATRRSRRQREETLTRQAVQEAMLEIEQEAIFELQRLQLVERLRAARISRGDPDALALVEQPRPNVTRRSAHAVASSVIVLERKRGARATKRIVTTTVEELPYCAAA